MGLYQFAPLQRQLEGPAVVQTLVVAVLLLLLNKLSTAAYITTFWKQTPNHVAKLPSQWLRARWCQQRPATTSGLGFDGDVA